MKLLEPRRPFLLVETKEQLQRATEALKQSLEVAVDAERASGFRYGSKAYLIQFATADEIFLIDPTQFESASYLLLASSVQNKRWLLHSATQDLPCLSEIGLRPTALFDTELAARLCGMERFGLSSIALELLDFEMAKEHSASDWSVRPIKPEMLVYAALDVDVMHELKLVLANRLEELGRTSWAEQEFKRLLSFQPKPASKDPWRNLPGISKIKETRKLQIAAALFQVRDEIASENDVAPGRLIPDRSIMAAVNQAPTTKKELAANKEFHGRASRSMLNTWWEAIANSTTISIPEPELDPNHIPNHRNWEKRFPEAHQRLQVIRPLVAKVAEELGIAIEILLSPDALRRVCFEPKEDLVAQLTELGARPWQVELVAPAIQSGLALGD